MFQYIPVCTVLQILVLPCTSMYLHIPFLVPSCTTSYHLVPPCTMTVQDSTYWNIPVHMDLGIFYQNEVSRTAMSPEAYVPGCTSTNCPVPPYTRCTGFQMRVTRANVGIRDFQVKEDILCESKILHGASSNFKLYSLEARGSKSTHLSIPKIVHGLCCQWD